MPVSNLDFPTLRNVLHVYVSSVNFSGLHSTLELDRYQFLARDVIYTSRAYATMSVSVRLSVCLSVTEVHCGHGAYREEGRGHLALC